MTDRNNVATRNNLISDLVKSSIEQAQKSHITYIEMNERILAETASESDHSFNEKALDAVKFDTEQNFKLALKLNAATDEQEAVAIRDEHDKAQGEEMAKRVAELQVLTNGASKEVPAIVEPVLETTIAQEERADPVQNTSAETIVAAAAAVGVTGAAAAAVSETLAAPASETVEPVAVSDEPISDEKMQAEIEALAVKIHDVENIETGTAEAREFDSELAELTADTPEIEGNQEVAIAVPDVQEVPDIEIATPAVEEVAEAAFAAPVVEQVAEAAFAAPAVEQVVEAAFAAPAVEQVAETAIVAPVVEQVAEAAFAAPVVEQVAENAIVAPVVEQVAEAEIAAPVVEQVAEAAFAAPVVEEVAEAAVAAPVVEQVADAAFAAPAVEQVAEAAVATEPQSFDTDLSARLEAVRAMLQGSSA